MEEARYRSMGVWLVLGVGVLVGCMTLAESTSLPNTAAGRAVAAVLTSLGVRQVVVLSPTHPRRRRYLHPHIGPPSSSRATEDRMEEVVRSLCEGGIQVSVSALPSSIVGSSATPPVVSHRGGASAHPSRPPTATSPKGGASSATRSPAKEEGKTQIPARDGVGETASNDTKTTKDEAARILEGFLLDTRGAVSTTSSVLVAGEASWVNQINQKTLLRQDQILVLYPTHGRIEKHSLVPHIRLAAKVIILERNEFQPGEGSAGGGGAERDNTSLSSCSFFIEQATLLSGGVYTLRTAGCWLRDHTLLLRQPLLPEIRSLRGAPVAVVIIKNFFEAIRVGPRRAYLVGYLGKLINALAETLDFHYNILEGTSFGVKSSNGSYDGVIGHIEREEGEIGLASLSITHRRYQAIDFTTWLRFQPSLFVTRGPRYLKDPMAVFRPYSWQMWVMIIFFLVFAAVWTWLLWRCGPSAGDERSQRLKRDGETIVTAWPSFMSVLALVFKTIVYQGSSLLPRGSPERAAHVSTWLVVLVLVGVFSGNLTAFLFRPVLSTPPTTIHQLVTRDWTIRLDKAYGSHDLVKETKTEDYQTLYRRAAQRGGIIENRGATTKTKTKLEDILNRDIAVVMGEPGAFHTLNENRKVDGGCLLTYGREAIGLEYAALAVPKKSFLKPLIDRKLVWMREMGTLERYYQGSFGVTCYRDNTESSEPSSLVLIQLLCLFYVWSAGLSLSCLMFMVEVFCGKFNPTKT